MRDVPTLAEHLANMVTAHDTPRYRTVLKDNIKFLERELSAALSEARAEGAREERERMYSRAGNLRNPHLKAVRSHIRNWLRAQSNTEE